MEPIDNEQLNDAFQKYYELYKKDVYSRVLRRLSRYGNDRQQAEDLFQTIFINVFRWMKNYQRKTNQLPPQDIVEKAFREIEITKYRSYIKKHIRRTAKEVPIVVSGDSQGEDLEYTDLIEPLTQGHQRPDRKFLMKELIIQIQNCLEKLKPHESLALLCKVRGDSSRQIAAITGWNEDTVIHSVIPLSKGKLRKCMERYFNGNEKR